MPTLTIDLPEAAYNDALMFGAKERVRLVAAAFHIARVTEEWEDDPDEPEYDRETNEADLEAIGRGLADETAGRTIPGEVLFVMLKEQARNGHK